MQDLSACPEYFINICYFRFLHHHFLHFSLRLQYVEEILTVLLFSSKYAQNLQATKPTYDKQLPECKDANGNVKAEHVILHALSAYFLKLRAIEIIKNEKQT